MIAVLDFGMGNIHSCIKALSRYSKNVEFTSDHDRIRQADAIVLPGDGHFRKAMENLTESGLDRIIHEFVEQGKPVLGICIGYQVLFDDSDESADGKKIKGLGLVKGSIRKFSGKSCKVPHMGWNKLHFSGHGKKSALLNDLKEGSFVYFIHSYRPVNVEPEAVKAHCNYYGEEFTAVVEKGNLMGTQFHPEKSDKDGLHIIENFVRIVEK